MKKVMVILGAYYPNPSANGICVGRVVDELLQNGYSVFCLCNSQLGAPDKEDIDNLHIQRIKVKAHTKYNEIAKKSSNKIQKVFYSLLSLLSDIFHIVKMTKNFPVASMHHSKKIFKVANSILVENDIDLVIGVNMPTDTMHAAYLLKKEHPNIDFIPYCLDPIYGGMDNKFLSKKVVDKRNCQFERKMLEASSLFIAQHEHREHFEKCHAQFADKLRFVGVPLLVNHNDLTLPPKRDKKVLLYAGALAKSTRNPAYIFEVFKHINNVKLIMYISNGEEWVKSAAKGIYNIEIHGRISHDEVLAKMNEADAFLNIGNTQTMFCPSKIVEYISYGKPIVSTYRTDNDTCSYYMSKYPLGVYLDERAENVRDAAQKIEKMIADNTKFLTYEELKELHADNTPAYVVDLIRSLHGSKKEN